MIAALPLVIQGITAVISAAPQIEAAVESAKNYITSLFEQGLITVDQQNAVHAHVDAVAVAVASGTPLPEWVVAPDPTN